MAFCYPSAAAKCLFTHLDQQVPVCSCPSLHTPVAPRAHLLDSASPPGGAQCPRVRLAVGCAQAAVLFVPARALLQNSPACPRSPLPLNDIWAAAMCSGLQMAAGAFHMCWSWSGERDD